MNTQSIFHSIRTNGVICPTTQPLHMLNVGVCIKVDILYNYNEDLEFFWDKTNVTHFKEEYVQYYKEKQTIPSHEHGKLDEKFREIILEKLGKYKEDVKVDHERLSHAFGFPIGIMKSIGKTSFTSVLDINKEFIILEESGKLTDPTLIPNPYLDRIVKLLNV